MIIVKLQGGLGNQMFQYAIGRVLSKKMGVELKMDIESYSNQKGVTPRKYSLSFFNIKESLANKKEIRGLKGGDDSLATKILRRLKIIKKHRFLIVEPHFNFYPEILNLNESVYLCGFWQTEKYFKDVKSVICKEFILKEEFSIEENNITKEIKKSNAISIHIRRGDYVTIATTSKFHGVCSLKYYVDAISFITEKVENPVFYVFSDDTEWVKDNLKINFPTRYVSNGDLKDYEELILMSYCKHNIIANSSFSWWGAWLNGNLEKIVVAPKQWFVDKSINTLDLIPEKWIRL